MFHRFGEGLENRILLIIRHRRICVRTCDVNDGLVTDGLRRRDWKLRFYPSQEF
jgi:hypothetical protein